MSRLNDMYQGVKKHTGKIVVCGLIVAIGLGIKYFANNMGEEVHRGNIGEYSVVYEENRFTLGTSSKFQKNRMTIQRGDTTYICEDIVDETNIGWRKQQKPDFEKDNLERVVVTTGISSKEHLNPNYKGKNRIDISTPEGQETQEVFDTFNPLYNNFRAIIREDLQSRYLAK